MNNIKTLLITFFGILVVVALVFYINPFVDTNKDSTSDSDIQNTNREPKTDAVISPTGEYIAYHIVNNSESFQTIELQNQKTKEQRVLDTANLNESFHSIMWNEEGARLYFARSTSSPKVITTLFYVDLNDYDPYAVTEIAYNDEDQVLEGEIKIVGEDANILYVQKDLKIYSLNLDEGVNAKPILYEDIGKEVETSNFEVIYDQENNLVFTNNVYGYEITFPGDWNIDENIDYLDIVGFYDSIAQQQTIESELIQGMKIEIKVELILSERSLEQIVENKLLGFSNFEILDQRNTMVDNRSAIEIEISVLGYNLTTFVKEGNYLYSITGYIGDINEKEKYTEMYRDILSTFVFIE